MALMKKLYSLSETREIMSYFGDWIGWQTILELYNQTAQDPLTSYFIVAKAGKLKVVDGQELIYHIVDGWKCELDSRVLFDNGICYYPEKSEE